MKAVEHIGKRIRLYRKQRKMTIDDLSAKLHLSPSTISKYENGKIAMDVETLFYIANVLEISIDNLVDYQEPIAKKIKDEFDDNFFKRSNIFYIYRYLGMEKKLCIDVLEIFSLEDERYDKIMIYNHCISEKEYTKCTKLYTGRIYYAKNTATLVAGSKLDEDDFLAGSFKASDKDIAYGIGTGQSDFFKKPFSSKLLASIKPLEHSKELKSLVKINDKDTINMIKEHNLLFAE